MKLIIKMDNSENDISYSFMSDVDLQYIRMVNEMCERGEYNDENVELIGHIIKLNLTKKEYPYPTVSEKTRYNDIKEKTLKLIEHIHYDNDGGTIVLHDGINSNILNINDRNDIKNINLNTDRIKCSFRIKNNELTCILMQEECNLHNEVLNNITFYSIITHIISERCGLVAKTISYNIGTLVVLKSLIGKLRMEIRGIIFKPPTMNFENGKLQITN